MNKKILKYQEYLDKYKYNNCPSQDFIEREFECFRWVHENVSEDDFLPQALIKEIPLRKLEKSDGCIYFGLSVHKDLTSSINAYKHRCRQTTREEALAKFKKQVGEYTTKLNIYKEDGISDLPNTINGHITFYQYTDCNFIEKIIDIIGIFT